MTKTFFDTLSPQENQRIWERTETLVDLLDNWARRYTAIRATRIPTAALVTAMSLSRLPPLDALPAAQVILWVFGFNDMVDEQRLTPEEMDFKAEQWYRIANHGSSNDADRSDELTAILLEIRSELSKSHLFERLRKHWASRLRILVQAMAQEHQYALQYSTHGNQTLPPLSEYVHGGLNSIGFPFWGATVLVLLRDSSVMEHLEAIIETIRYAGAAARLYNDVRSLDREIQEKNINSAFIIYHTMLEKDSSISRERGLSEARQQVLELADSYAQRSYDLVRQFSTESGQIEEVISRVVAFHSYCYGHSERGYDYYTTSSAQVHKKWE